MKQIFITVDTECHDIERINQYIYGEYKSGECGLKRILELGKEQEIPINFFFDIGECKRYGDEYALKIVNLIHSYNQPIFFHFHPNYISDDDKRTYLWEYSKEEQEKYYKEALDIYTRFCGEKDRLIFRAGRYGVEPQFYDILNEYHNCVLDLSYFNGNMKMCRLPKEEVNTINKPVIYKGVTILPNTTYIGFDYFGKKASFILNCANTTHDEFKSLIDRTNLSNLVYTMHSWDLMKKWFFNTKFVTLDKHVEKRLKKNIKYAKKKGFSFGNLNNCSCNVEDNDEQLNLCKGFWGKIKGLFNNYVRFWIIGRLNKKYFLFYLITHLGLISLIGLAILGIILL